MSFNLAINNLTYTYPDGSPALNDLSLEFKGGQSVCLAGPNGAGKTTLLEAIAGLTKPQGEIALNNLKVGLVFQDADDQLFCPTVYDDVAFGPRNQKCSEEEITKRVTEALTATGLIGFEKRSAHHLSGGEKKRAAIAAVLACKPDILALDEPWANLDARGARAVTEIIANFKGTRIVSSQDLYHAADVCERMIILDGGKLVADGAMPKILGDKALLEKHGIEFGARCRHCPTIKTTPPPPLP